MTRKTIALFGSSGPVPGEPLYELAGEIGRELAASGFDLINGGHEGTMEAASRAAREAGARVTGVTCGLMFAARGAAPNRHLHKVIDAPTLFARIEIMIRRAGGYVIMEGGTGTLAELGMVWEHVNKGFVIARPIVCVGDFWRPVIETIAAAQAGARRQISIVSSAEEVATIMRARAIDVDAADSAFRGGSAGEERRAHG